MKNSPKEIIIHCTDVSYKTQWNQFASVNAYHRGEGFLRSLNGLYVGYHRLITGDQNYKCKEDFEEGCHCNQLYEDGASMNLRSLGICIGFDGDKEQMYPGHYEMLQRQIKAWQDQYMIPSSRVKFHRTYNKSKTCPGSLLDDKWLATLLDPRASVPATQSPPPATSAEKPPEQCAKQEAIINIQTELISTFRKLLNFLFPN